MSKGYAAACAGADYTGMPTRLGGPREPNPHGCLRTVHRATHRCDHERKAGIGNTSAIHNTNAVMALANAQYGQSDAPVSPPGLGMAGFEDPSGAILTSLSPDMVHICAQAPPTDTPLRADNRRPAVGKNASSSMAASASSVIRRWKATLRMQHAFYPWFPFP